MIVWISILAVVAVGAGAFFVAAKFHRAKQITATQEAQQRMDKVSDSNSDTTSDRLRDGDF